MPKEDFTEREIRKIRELIAFLLKLRSEGRMVEMRQQLDEVAAENEFPSFSKLLEMDVPGFNEKLRGLRLNAAVCNLYFQLMEAEASLTSDEWKREGLYYKAMYLGEYAEELDRTFTAERTEMIRKIKEELGI